MAPPFIFFSFLFCLFIFHYPPLLLSANLPPSQCSNDGPRISHPFHLNPQQHRRRRHQSYEAPSGFELFCQHNLTTIRFPSYGGLVVKSISYPTKRINLLDPRNCVHKVFLTLNLSLTPFHYFYVLKNYTYLNCSTSLPRPFMEIPCLSGSNFHVYTVEPSLSVPGSCVAVKTVAIPFEYSPFLSDNTLGLGFTWDSCQLQETRSGHTVVLLSICMCVLAISVLLSMKVQWSWRNWREKEGQLLQSL